MQSLTDIKESQLSKILFEGKHTLGLTIQTIKDILNDGRQLFFARKIAEQILLNVPDRVTDLEFKAIYEYVTKTARYTKDIFNVEMVKTIEALYNEIKDTGRFIGDCDDVSVLMSGLLKSVGYKVRLIVVSTMKNTKDTFDHIFVQVLDPKKNEWLAMDGVLRNKNFGDSINYKKFRIFEV